MATHAHSTDADRRRPIRRALLAGSAAVTAAASGAAAIDLWPTDDADLMRAIDRIRGCHAEVVRLEANNDHTWDAVEVSGRAWARPLQRSAA